MRTKYLSSTYRYYLSNTKNFFYQIESKHSIKTCKHVFISLLSETFMQEWSNLKHRSWNRSRRSCRNDSPKRTGLNNLFSWNYRAVKRFNENYIDEANSLTNLHVSVSDYGVCALGVYQMAPEARPWISLKCLNSVQVSPWSAFMKLITVFPAWMI